MSNEMIEKRIYSENNITKFRDHLREENFINVLETERDAISYDNFIVTLKSICYKAFPVTKCKPNTKHIKKGPWITDGLLISSRTKLNLLKKRVSRSVPFTTTYQHHDQIDCLSKIMMAIDIIGR